MKLWDIRSKQIVYELATGNNSVNTVIWNARNTTLYAATACEWQDHLGYFHGYRRARPLNSDRNTKPKTAEDADNEDQPDKKRRRTDAETVDNLDEDEDDDDEDEDDDDEDEDDEDEDDDKDWDGKCWPDRAYHLENYFGTMFDAADHRLCTSCWSRLARTTDEFDFSTDRYQFKHDADITVVPAYGDGQMSQDGDMGPGDCGMQ